MNYRTPLQVNGTETDEKDLTTSPLQSPGEIEHMTVVDEVNLFSRIVFIVRTKIISKLYDLILGCRVGEFGRRRREKVNLRRSYRT